MNLSTSEYIATQPDGSWRIAGTRVSLASLVHAYWNGRLPEAIVADFPSLTLEQVHGAIAYYLKHRAEVDRYLVEQEKEWSQLQHTSTAQHGPLQKRILQTSATSSQQ